MAKQLKIAQPSLLLSLVLYSCIYLSSARKTYVVKEKIANGDIKVLQPRVQSVSNEWCWFENGDNKWCVTGDETWTLGYVNEYNFQEDTDTTNNIPPNFLATLNYESTQDASWDSEFNLERLLYNKLSFAMNEFVTGFRFELYYWIDSYAFCLNFVHRLDAMDISVVSKSSVVQCSKTVIDCFDDWSTWTDEDAAYMSCDQSSTSDVTVYSYIPVTDDQENYLLGWDDYVENYCWPGYSPFYSYFYQYPSNLQYAFSQMVSKIEEFYNDWTSTRAGYRSTEKREEPKVETSNGFDYFTAGQEIIKLLRYAINFQSQSMDGEIKRSHTLDELSEFTNQSYLQKKAARDEKGKSKK